MLNIFNNLNIMPKEEVKTKEEKPTPKIKEKKPVDAKDVETKKVQLDPFSGKFISALGKRKTATAQVRLYKEGKGIVTVNGLKLNEYFMPNLITVVNKPLKLTTHLKDLNFSIIVKGGGKIAQAEAIVHGISRTLVAMDPELRAQIKTKGWLTRDARKKERKKPGLKKARRAPQWSKR